MNCAALILSSLHILRTAVFVRLRTPKCAQIFLAIPVGRLSAFVLLIERFLVSAIKSTMCMSRIVDQARKHGFGNGCQRFDTADEAKSDS